MRLPRNVKVFRGQLDAAPFAGMLFLVLMFLVLQSKLVFTPVIPLRLPEVPINLSGTPDFNDMFIANLGFPELGEVHAA